MLMMSNELVREWEPERGPNKLTQGFPCDLDKSFLLLAYFPLGPMALWRGWGMEESPSFSHWMHYMVLSWAGSSPEGVPQIRDLSK